MGLFALVGAAAVLFALRLVMARLQHLDALERVVAGGLIFLAAILAIHLVPLLLGVLSLGTVLVAAALTAGVALRIRPVSTVEPDRPHRDLPTSGPVSWGLAALVAGVVLVVMATAVRDTLPLTFIGLDITTFHLPHAASWIETGSLWQTDIYTPLQPYGYYPNNGELLYVWVLLPFDNEFLVRWVMIPLLGLWAVAAFAVVRELGGPPATGVLAASALMTIPVVGKGTVDHALPDILLYASMTAGLLFLLRHRRSGRRSDLVLAGIGIGIGFGTKWYGVSTAAIALLVWAGARMLRERRARRAVLGDAAVVGGVAALAGGVWLVRNLVESGNPIFPVRVAPLGVTIFDAPPDVVREVAGFSVAHYLGDPDVLFDILPAEIVEGAGLLAPLAVVFLVVAALTAQRSLRRRGRMIALGVAALVLAAAYAVTPYSALGAEGEPYLANFNTRYLVPALTVAALAGAAAARRAGLGPLVELLLAIAALASMSEAYGPLRGGTLVKTAVALGVLAGAAVVAWRVWRKRPPGVRRVLAVGAAGVVAIGIVGYANRSENRFNLQRYTTFDRAMRASQDLSSNGSLDVGLAGLWSTLGVSPVWPSFGPRARNHVEYVGFDNDGWLNAYDRPGQFISAVREAGYDLLVVGRGRTPRPRVREEAWARAAGYVEVARSDRLILYASPALARDAASRAS
jgi:hypothetical protein